MSRERSIHTVLVPALLCSPRLYEPVLPTLWSFGATTVADTRRDDSVAEMAQHLGPTRYAGPNRSPTRADRHGPGRTLRRARRGGVPAPGRCRQRRRRPTPLDLADHGY